MDADLRLIDIFSGDALRKPEHVRDKTQNEIAPGRFVIFAWCYSVDDPWAQRPFRSTLRIT